MATLQQLQDAFVKADAAGEEKDAQTFADSIRAHPTFQQNARESLESGKYKMGEDFQTLTKDEQLANMSKQVARSLGLKDSEVDVTQGMGTYGRFKLSFQPTEQDKVKHLEDTYGRENIRAVEVGGKTKLLYRDEQETGNQFRAVDEEGTSLADFFGDTAGEVLPTTGAIVGGVAGSFLSPVLGTTAGAAAGYATVAGLQDVVARAVSGEDIRPGEIAKRTAIETAIGIPIDLATAGVGKFFARRIAGRAASSLVDEVDGAIVSVNKQLDRMSATKLPEVEALRTGAGSKQANEIAAQRPTSQLAVQLQGVRDKLSEYKELVSGKGRAGASTDDFNRVSEEVGKTYRGLVDEIGKVDKGLAKELEGQASRKLRQMSAPKVNPEDVGVKIRELLSGGVENIENTNAANWKNLQEIGGGVNVPIKEIIRRIELGTSGFKRTELPQAKAILRDLKKVLNGKEGEPTGLFDSYGKPIMGKGVKGKESVDFNEFKEIIDTISETVSRNKEAGFGLKERIATKILKEFTGDPKNNKLGLRGLMGIRNPELGQALGNTLEYYKNNLLATKRSAVGRTLREQLADPAISPSQVAKLAIQDPAYIKQALSIAGQAGDGGASQSALRSQLQDMYLNRIGLIGDVDPKTMNLQFEDEIVAALWGDGKVKQMRNLQQRLIQSKGIKAAELSVDDVNSYLTALTGDEKDRILKGIVKRSAAKQKLAKQKNAILLRKMQPKYDKQTGTWLEPEVSGMSLAKFSDGFIGADTTQVIRAMKLMEAQGDDLGIQAFRQSYIGNLLDSYSAGAQIDSFGNTLWNPKALKEAMKPGTKLRNNMDAILGKDGALEILDANRVLLEAAESGGSKAQQAFQPRYSLTSGGVQFYGVGNVLGSLRGRALAWAYGSKSGAKMMRFLTNKGDDAATEKMLQKLLPALMTSSGGMKAAAIQGQFDPEFTEQIAPLFNDGQVEAGQ